MAGKEKFHLLEHPLLQHYLTRLRDVKTRSAEFRNVLDEISRAVVYEALRDLQLEYSEVETPMAKMEKAPHINERLAIVSIMRAGNGMLDSALKVVPFAHVGHIGIYRDRFIKSTVEYFIRLPKDISECQVLLLDPMLATGDTAVSATTRLKESGAQNIRFLCVLAAPEGLEKFQQFHPDVPVYAISLEDGLDHDGFVLPGVGDVSGRLYGPTQ